jgi:hypothetical protein
MESVKKFSAAFFHFYFVLDQIDKSKYAREWTAYFVGIDKGMV